MIKRVLIDHFRGIGPKPLEVDLAPLTVLVGPNGTGKSSILEAIALTAQSAVEDPSRHDLVLAGTKFSLPDGSEALVKLNFERDIDQLSTLFGSSRRACSMR